MQRLGFAVGITLFCVSCATPSLPPVSLNFFVPAPSDDPWNQKIASWQKRHRLDPARGAEMAPQASELGSQYEDFTRTLRRRIAAEAVAWVQEKSRIHYRADGEHDHWATLGEVIRSDGDDCDGLDLLTFLLLRRLGFQDDEIYRAIIVERESGQHHMVTLWFEPGVTEDPLVLDPTGVVTAEMVPLSQIDGWEPIQLFDEQAHYRVETRPAASAVSGR